jgi:hypothetical protein
MKTFLFTKIQGDYNISCYSKSKKNGEQWSFIPHAHSNEIEWKAEIKRGNTFFKTNEGFPFGVILNLNKLGTIKKEMKY